MSRPSSCYYYCGPVRRVSNNGSSCSPIRPIRPTRVSNSVVATQRNAGELSHFFNKLRDREVARKFNHAVCAGDACAIERLLGRHCRVIRFSKKGHFCCVKIECKSKVGRRAETRTVLSICVRKVRRRRR